MSNGDIVHRKRVRLSHKKSVRDLLTVMSPKERKKLADGMTVAVRRAGKTFMAFSTAMRSTARALAHLPQVQEWYENNKDKIDEIKNNRA